MVDSASSIGPSLCKLRDSRSALLKLAANVSYFAATAVLIFDASKIFT